MSLETLSDNEIDNFEKQLLEKVPKEGPISNKSLRSKLKWNDDDLYWNIRSRLVDKGRLEVGRGKGGTVRLTPIVTESAAENVDQGIRGDVNNSPQEKAQRVDTELPREVDLYEPVAKALEQWAKEQGFDNYSVEITARQGSRQTGGKWTRPDLAVIGSKAFPYIQGRTLEVVTFEVKPYGSVDVASVYEALAHRRAATRAYVVLHVPEKFEKNDDGGIVAALDAIYEEAKRHGIGVIVAAKPGEFDEWDVRCKAERFNPDPSNLNEFIALQLSDDLKQKIIKWFK